MSILRKGWYGLMSKLEPCPFCGGEAAFLSETRSIKCKSCGGAFICTSPVITFTEVAEAWNNRTSDKKSKVEVDKMMIKNLSQLKRALQVGTRFEILYHWKKECTGEIRRVASVNTVSIHTVVDGQPEHKNSVANGGKGTALWFEKATEWEFRDGVCSVYFRNKPHSEETLIMSFRLLPEEVA